MSNPTGGRLNLKEAKDFLWCSNHAMYGHKDTKITGGRKFQNVQQIFYLSSSG
jgi:hypothetical protein